MIWLGLFIGIAFGVLCAGAAYRNGVADGYGYSCDPCCPGYTRAGAYVEKYLAHRYPTPERTGKAAQVRLDDGWLDRVAKGADVLVGHKFTQQNANMVKSLVRSCKQWQKKADAARDQPGAEGGTDAR